MDFSYFWRLLENIGEVKIKKSLRLKKFGKFVWKVSLYCNILRSTQNTDRREGKWTVYSLEVTKTRFIVFGIPVL